MKYELLKSVFLLNSEDISAQHHCFALIQQFVIFLVLLDLKFDDVLFNGAALQSVWLRDFSEGVSRLLLWFILTAFIRIFLGTAGSHSHIKMSSTHPLQCMDKQEKGGTISI